MTKPRPKAQAPSGWQKGGFTLRLRRPHLPHTHSPWSSHSEPNCTNHTCQAPSRLPALTQLSCPPEMHPPSHCREQPPSPYKTHFKHDSSRKALACSLGPPGQRFPRYGVWNAIPTKGFHSLICLQNPPFLAIFARLAHYTPQARTECLVHISQSNLLILTHLSLE